MKYLVFDIGGTSIKIGLLNEKGIILEKNRVKTPDNYLDFLKILNENISKYEFEIKGICFSSPGTIDKKTGEITGISAIPYIHKNNFCKYLYKKYKIKVSIENDANCSSLGEIYFSNNKYKIAVFLVIGTGIGGSIIINNQIFSGNKNEAGEFGYILLNKKKENNFSKNTLINISNKLKKEINIDIDTYELLEKYFNKISPFYELVKESFENLAIGIYNIKYMIDPEVIIIGGAISSNIKYIEEIKKYVQKLNVSIEIKSCKYNNDSNLLGALANFLQNNIIEGENYEI